MLELQLTGRPGINPTIMHMLCLKSSEHSVNVRTNKCKLKLLEIISSLGVFFYYYYLVQNSIIYKFGP